MLLSKSKDSLPHVSSLGLESCTRVWEVEDTVEGDLSAWETYDSLFLLEETGRASGLLSHLFGTCPSGF